MNTRRLTLDAKFYPDRFFPNRELPKRAPIVYLTREGNFNSARWVRRTKNSMPDQVWSDKILHNGSGCGCLKPSGLFYGRGAEPHLLTNVLSAISYKQINGCVGAACWRQIATPRAKTQPQNISRGDRGIRIEDLKVSGMVNAGKLPSPIGDHCFYEICRQLVY